MDTVIHGDMLNRLKSGIGSSSPVMVELLRPFGLVNMQATYPVVCHRYNLLVNSF